jgi:hypothetical protein
MIDLSMSIQEFHFSWHPEEAEGLLMGLLLQDQGFFRPLKMTKIA